MNRDDIIRIAREAGINVEQGFLLRFAGVEDDLERFAALVAAAERKRIISANAPEIERINEYIKTLEAALRQAQQSRQWQGLTDEEIDYLCGLAYTGDEELILTIQSKLREKNT